MKKTKQKSKDGRGGARPGAGGGTRWKHGRTKLVRLPVALLDEMLEVARYMDQNEGRLPSFAPPVIISGRTQRTFGKEQDSEAGKKNNGRRRGGVGQR